MTACAVCGRTRAGVQCEPRRGDRRAHGCRERVSGSAALRQEVGGGRGVAAAAAAEAAEAVVCGTRLRTGGWLHTSGVRPMSLAVYAMRLGSDDSLALVRTRQYNHCAHEVSTTLARKGATNRPCRVPTCRPRGIRRRVFVLELTARAGRRPSSQTPSSAAYRSPPMASHAISTVRGSHQNPNVISTAAYLYARWMPASGHAASR